MARHDSMLLIVDAQELAFPGQESAPPISETLHRIRDTTTALRGHMHIGWAAFFQTRHPKAGNYAHLLTRKPQQLKIWTEIGSDATSGLLEVVAPREGDIFVPKCDLSALSNQGFISFLRAENVRHLFVGGFYTGSCVARTCNSAKDLGEDKKLFPHGMSVTWVSDLSHDRLIPNGMETSPYVVNYLREFKKIPTTTSEAILARHPVRAERASTARPVILNQHPN